MKVFTISRQIFLFFLINAFFFLEVYLLIRREEIPPYNDRQFLKVTMEPHPSVTYLPRPCSTSPRCSSQQNRTTRNCDHRLAGKNFHTFAHQLSEFPPFTYKLGVTKTLIDGTTLGWGCILIFINCLSFNGGFTSP